MNGFCKRATCQRGGGKQKSEEKEAKRGGKGGGEGGGEGGGGEGGGDGKYLWGEKGQGIEKRNEVKKGRKGRRKAPLTVIQLLLRVSHSRNIL